MIKRTLTLIAAMSSSLMAHDAFGQEQPPGCNASAVGVRLVPTVNLVPIPPDTCVIPGQEITYRTNPFISPNPPPVLGIVYCDVFGGQLGVTFPNWEDALPPGSLRPDQFVPVAGYVALPDVPAGAPHLLRPVRRDPALLEEDLVPLHAPGIRDRTYKIVIDKGGRK